MEAEKTYQNKVARTIQQKRNGEGALEFADNRPAGILRIFNNKPTIQRATMLVNQNTDSFYDDVYNNTMETVGTHVTILLDPTDIKGGSEPGHDLDNTMKAIKHRWNPHWVKGHLINHHLGGPGIGINLYPITKSANNYHCNYVENVVLNKLGNISAPQGILYSVKVTEANHKVSNPKSKLTCEAYVVGDVNNINTITSFVDGVNIISEPTYKPKPELAGGLDIFGNVWSSSRNLASQKRTFPGWGYFSKGVNKWW